MSNPFSDEVADKAMRALREQDPDKAATQLRKVLAGAPDRIDVLHALAVTELRRGDPRAALVLAERGEELARQKGDATAETLMPQLYLAHAAACEDLYDAVGAETAFREILRHEPGNPRARQGLGHLLLGWGRTEEGLAELKGYLEDDTDDPPFLEATASFVKAVESFVAEDVHPRHFLEAHRGGYNEFFDHHARQMAERGWIAEAARMRRGDDGAVVPIIPEGARPYAGTRIDLVDPNTGQGGQVGDGPMVVALVDYEPLAQAPVLFSWPAEDYPFPVWVSSQAPWNHLPVQVRFVDTDDAVDVLDPVIGDWYMAGFEGQFGTREVGRFHEIGDPEPVGARRVVYHLDCGRSDERGVADLLRRLTVLHSQAPIAAVIIGRGYLP